MISVIICTYNPRRDYLEQTLAALRAQTLDVSLWDLLIVDNNSDTPLMPEGLVDWHPSGRVVREEEPGIVAARFRGVAETTGELLVFVDDDNVLDSLYLEDVTRLSRRIPSLGAFGSGLIEPVFENGQVPMLSRFVRGQLTIRRADQPIWSSVKATGNSPSGAGMVVRRAVAESYVQRCRNGEWTLVNVFRLLGLSLKTPGGDDFDLGYESANLDMAMGVFPSLKMKHLMPPERLEVSYLRRMIRSNARSMALLGYVHHGGILPRHRMPRREPLNRLMATMKGKGFDFQFRHEWRLGEVDAYQLVMQHKEELERLRHGAGTP